MTQAELFELMHKVARLTDQEVALISGSSVRMARRAAQSAVDVALGGIDPTIVDWRKVGSKAVITK